MHIASKTQQKKAKHKQQRFVACLQNRPNETYAHGIKNTKEQQKQTTSNDLCPVSENDRNTHEHCFKTTKLKQNMILIDALSLKSLIPSPKSLCHTFLQHCFFQIILMN